MIRPQFKIVFIIISIFFLQSNYAQTVVKLNCLGNKVFSDLQYNEWASSISKGVNDSTIIDSLKKQLTNKLGNNGYNHHKYKSFTLDSTKSNAFYATLEIDEGRASIIRSISFSKNLDENDKVAKIFNPLLELQFIKEDIEAKIEAALNHLENNGYPFAEIAINSILFEDSGDGIFVDLHLTVERNELRTIDQVQLIGNTKTDNSLIINSIRIEKGEIYSQEKINNIPVQLNKLRFFSKVDQPKYLVNSNNKGILEISLAEKNTNSFDGILGYIPARDDEESGYITGFVNISLRNLFGTGRIAAFRWQQENSHTQELELKYLEPWILNYPFNITLEFFQRKQDSSYVKRMYGGSLEFLATENISASLILEGTSVIPSLNKSDFINILNSSSLNSGLQLKLDYRDDIFAPTNGLYFVSTYKFKSKSIDENSGSQSNFDYHNYELDFGGYYSIFQNQVLAIGLHAKEIIGDSFDLSDFYKLGGANSLRGFREKQFLGNRIFWSNLEYRFMLSQQSYIFGFYDLGYFSVKLNEENSGISQSDYNNGYGLGLSLETGLGIMKVSYAFAEGTSITDGLIHFGLVNEF